MTMENAETPSTCTSMRLAKIFKKLMETQEHQPTAMELEKEDQKKQAHVQTPCTSTVEPSVMVETQKTSLEVKTLHNESPHQTTPMAQVLFDIKGTKPKEES